MNDEIRAAVDELVAALDRDGEPGGALAVYHAGELVYARGFGCANLELRVRTTPGTVFHVASLSKQFTALAVALLAREGRLSLDGDIREYVPELTPGPNITLRHLIHHTSGLRDQWDLLHLAGWRHADLKTTADILYLATKQKSLNFAPGTRYQYINIGYTLLATAVARVSGRSLHEFCAERIFGPLGMTSTRFQEDHQALVPGRAHAYSRGPGEAARIDMPAYETVGPTGLLSTVTDFARWEGNFCAPRVGDAALIAEAMAPGALVDGRPVNYGFGLVLGEYRGARIVEHAGGDAGFRAHYLRVPDAGWAVAVFGNSSELKPGDLARQIADISLDGHLAKRTDDGQTTWSGRAAGAGRVLPADVGTRVGMYRELASGQAGWIELRDARPFLMSGDGGEYELVPVSRDHFRFADVAADCYFHERDGEPLVMRVFFGGQLTGVCERAADVARPLPVIGRAEEYAGSYFSEELEVRYRIACVDGEPRLGHVKLGDMALRALMADEFYAGASGWQLHFVRDGKGRISGFKISAERAWKVYFARE
jgi:CubicO group peptidase (beta-lactamase class C family)